MYKEYSIIPTEVHYVFEKEKITLPEALSRWSRIEAQGFKLVRAGNYPIEVTLHDWGTPTTVTAFPIIEILYVK